MSSPAAINDYIYPNSDKPSFSNYGTIGLVQMPSARMHTEGTLAVSFSAMDPYYRGSLIAYPFSRLEASYQYTDINNALYSDVPAFSGNQTYKDKGFSAKILLFKESNLFPALAIGARDIAGTGIFSSEYIVASKRLNNIDLSFGLGWGILSANKLSNPFTKVATRLETRDKEINTKGGDFNVNTFFSGEMGVFAGAEIFIPNSNGMRIKVEYDATDYTREGFALGRASQSFAFEPVRQSASKINAGLIYPVTDSFHLKLNYVKGHTISLGFSLQANLGSKNPMIQKNDDHKNIKNSESIKRVNAKDQVYVYKTALKYLAERDLYLQNANIDSSTLQVVYAQSTHTSWPRASGRVLRVLDEIAPNYVDTLEVLNVNGGLGMHSITVNRESFSKYKDKGLYKLASKDFDLRTWTYDPEEFSYSPAPSYPSTFSKIAPSVRSQIGGPDGFYFGDLRLAFLSETLFSRNISFIINASAGLYDNFDELKLASDSILPHVRTDIVKYLKNSRSFALKRAHFNIFFNPYPDIYSKVAFGYLEEMFGGAGGEFLYRPFDQDYGIGAEIWRVKKRSFDQRLSFANYMTTTGHINLFYQEPVSKILIALKGGKFLAGDSGINFNISRRFASGLRTGIFFSRTDISKEEFGEGSFDKGFYFHLPIDIFFDKHSKGAAGFGLRPVTRDGAALLVHSHDLWGVTEQGQANNITRDWDDLYD
ncbi:YjbH domain-containing protein [Gammaproteobacteria bacterium]|nr:YjbH domain-containing protein [Gammaproteobacteria bacterium]MDA9979758.1 YjbH domain-containing protein [Gammaproteobacteria bacterium]MDC3371961.1 YjbH domain-containing protein [Gammaproteobacteria bacterium]